jgi:hypothetical protein
MSERDERVSEEEAAAAAEAGAIGGPNPDPDLTDEERVIAEGGEGESEGFEMAERDLERNATHDDGRGNPALDEFQGDDPGGTAEYGDADREGMEGDENHG